MDHEYIIAGIFGRWEDQPVLQRVKKAVSPFDAVMQALCQEYKDLYGKEFTPARAYRDLFDNSWKPVIWEIDQESGVQTLVESQSPWQRKKELTDLLRQTDLALAKVEEILQPFPSDVTRVKISPLDFLQGVYEEQRKQLITSLNALVAYHDATMAQAEKDANEEEPPEVQ